MRVLVSRAEAARILGCSDAAVGRIRAGNYPAGELEERYRLLVEVLERAAKQADAQTFCAACRIAELT